MSLPKLFREVTVGEPSKFTDTAHRRRLPMLALDHGRGAGTGMARAVTAG